MDTAEPARSARVTPRRFSRGRLAFFRTVETAARLLGGAALYRRRHLAPGRLVLREERIAVPCLPAEFQGFTIAHWSDLHAGSFVGPGSLAAALELVAARRPDVHVLSGDFVTHAVTEIERIAPDLARLRAEHGAFAVFGNHDYKGRREAAIAAALPAVRFLRNECVRIERGSASALALVGLEDLEEGRTVDVDAARAGVRPGDVEILLCHHPLGAARLARPGCAVILSGHTHGTQVDLPFLRRLGPVHPGSRVILGATTLIVSRGVGVVGLPWRHRSPAEVVLVRLERA